MNRSRIIWLVAILLMFSACTPRRDSELLTPWDYTDLRLIDPANAENSSQDLIAVYLRQAGGNLQIRLDFLEGIEQPEADLYLAIDAAHGGTYDLPLNAPAQVEWDTLLTIPAHGEIATIDPSGNPRPESSVFVLRDPAQDALYIEINRQALNGSLAGFSIAFNPRLQVFVVQPGTQLIVDESEPAQLDAPPPPPARLLLAFWDSYLAYTPATALRRWDGAHTGPLGGRHGLYNLLRTAQAAGIPLALLDLKSPAWLSALDYAGGLSLAQEMEQAGLLILPETLPDPHFAPFTLPETLSSPWLESATKTSLDFGLSKSPFVYQPYENVGIPAEGQGIFHRYCDSGKPDESPNSEPNDASELPLLYPQRWRGQIILPLLDRLPEGEQVSREGITPEWRHMLVQAALASAEQGEATSLSYLQMGGSLPESAWGDPESARAGFRWLKAHPWVQALDGVALLTANPSTTSQLHPCKEDAPKSAPPVDSSALAAALLKAPANSLSLAAWQAYQALFAPVYPAPPELQALRTAYIGDVWSLLEAASWADSPAQLATCERDPDRDGQPECLLASESFCAQFEIESGGLTHFFAAYTTESAPQDWNDRVHQIIGPSSQFISGMSDPATWKLEDGSLSDPSVIPGAFFGPESGYQASWSDYRLVFTSQNGESQKTFQLAETGLQIEHQLIPTTLGAKAQIPMVLDPWRRFEPGWADQFSSQSAGQMWSWQVETGPQIQVRTSTSLSGAAFNPSRLLFINPENPNQDFPGGHFIPFPLALVEIKLEQNTQIELRAIPAP